MVFQEFSEQRKFISLHISIMVRFWTSPCMRTEGVEHMKEYMNRNVIG